MLIKMIVDVDLTALKKLGMASSGFLLYESENTFEFYYSNKGPIVFRTIVKKDDNALALLTSIKISVRLLSPLKDIPDNKNVVELLTRIEKRLVDINMNAIIRK